MTQKIPPLFRHSVARDLWQWQHLEIPLLPESEQDRLLFLPDPEASEPYGESWIGYAREMALTLEQSRYWEEAQAYWYACLQLLVGVHAQQTTLHVEALLGLVRTGSSAIGVLPQADTFEEIVDESLKSLSLPIQQAMIYSLFLIGTHSDSLFDDLDLSQPARITLSTLLTPLHDQRIKGSHTLFMESVRLYSQILSSLRTAVEVSMTNGTLEGLKGQRARILERLSRLQGFVSDTEKIFLTKMQSLLGQDLSNYLKAKEEAIGEAHAIFQEKIRYTFTEGQLIRSHLSNCLFLPFLLSLEQASALYLMTEVNSRLPEMHIHLLKPQARWLGNDLYVEIQIENRGTDIAQACTLSVQEEGSTDIQEPIEIGLMASEQSTIAYCRLATQPQITVLMLQCRLQWRDRLGIHQVNELLKAERQQAIDWNALIDAAPYAIQSIMEPEKLKGRNEQLRALRLGFASKGSFMITGQKRVGKTSLVNVFLQEWQERRDILALYIPIGELSAASGDDLGRIGYELVKRLLEAYLDTFGIPATIELPPIDAFRESFSDVFAQCFRQFTKQHTLRLALALDDFDELPTSLFTGPVGRTFFLSLRALINRGVSFFFIGSERLPTIVKEQAERLNQIRTIKVDYLDREALFALIEEPVKGQLTYTHAALLEIEQWSARNPFFATLLSQAIWEQAIERKDAWITEHDVHEAITTFAMKSNRNSYEHFWSDSPLATDDDRQAYETRSSSLLLALSKLQEHPFSIVNRRHVLAQCDLIDKEEAGLHLQELINYNVLETHMQQAEYVRIRVPLFTHWLQHGGALELQQDELLKRKYQDGITMRAELPASEVVAAADRLSYRGRTIGSDEVRVWVSQFGGLEDQRLMLKLLRQMRDHGHYNEERLLYAVKQLHELVRQRARERDFPIHVSSNNRHQTQNIYVTSIDTMGESGSALVRSYRTQNAMLERVCGLPDKVLQAIRKNVNEKAILICVDDFIGSGHSAAGDIRNFLIRLEHAIPNWSGRVLPIYATITGFESGIRFIQEHVPQQVAIVVYKILAEADKAFSEENTIFETSEERRRAYQIAHKIGLILQKENPLGWEDSQALVVFPENVPNNTLPIFYRHSVEYNGQPWRALFPRS